MKRILSFILLGLTVTNFAQDMKGAEFPVYPGCEKLIKENANCFQQKIANDLTEEIEKYSYAFEYLNIPKAEATVDFLINKEGHLILKNITSSQPQFKEYVHLAFDDLVMDLQNNKRQIIPAKTKIDQKPLSVSLKLPVNFTLNNHLTINNNRLIAVLNDGFVKYEIVMTPNLDFKIYEVNESRTIYLGKYTSLQEIQQTLPYSDLIKNASNTMILGVFDYGNEKFSLQINNFFRYKDFVTEFVIFSIKNKKTKKLARFQSMKDFHDSPYYQWLKR